MTLRRPRSLLVSVVSAAALLSVPTRAQTLAAPCELDWNGDGRVDVLDLADSQRLGGYYYEWLTLAVTPARYPAFFPSGSPSAVDWNEDGRIAPDDLLGLEPARPIGFYWQYVVYVDPRYRAAYRYAFPTSGCPRPGPGNVLERDLQGRKTLLVIPVSFSRSSLSPVASQAEAQAHGESVVQMLSDQSHGILDMRATATPVLDMPRPHGFYHGGGQINFVRLRADIAALAAQRGYDLTRYDYGLVLCPKFWSTVNSGFARAWKLAVNSTLNVPLSTHELGHTFGWSHAARWDCPAGGPLCTSGVLVSDGDHFDVMGKNSTIVGRFGPWEQYRAGWLPGNSTVRVTRTGDYTIKSLASDPMALGPGEHLALELRIDPVRSYWVFFRGDEPLASDGVMITESTNEIRGQSVLYDMTPGSPAGWRDARLAQGQTFHDPSAGISVHVNSVTAAGVDVRVTVPPSIRSIPKPPVIDVVSPTRHQTVRGTWTFELTAYSPARGAINGAGIRNVTLRLNGAPTSQGHSLSRPPYRVTMDTIAMGLSDGQYRLFIEAFDEAGVRSQTICPLYIDNTGPSF